MLHSNSPASLLNRTAPEFSLPDTEGELVSLHDLRGSKVVLVFLRHFA
jgi:peroxiredoxin